MGVDEEKNILDSILDSVIVIDKEEKIRDVNQATLDLLGYKSREEMAMLPFEKIYRNFSTAGLKDKLPLAEREMIYLNKDGKEIPISVNITARISYPDDVIFIGRDISRIKDLINESAKTQGELRTSYEQLRFSKDDLVRSEKLAFTGRIAASIAHEIRNPLTNVFISIQRFNKCHYILKGGCSTHIEIVRRNVERINCLITELLDCARPAKLNLEHYDIYKVVKDVLELSKAQINVQKIKVTKNFTAKLCVLKIDKEQIKRAFSNLITNAIEALPRGGNVTIITDINGKNFLIKVQDTGKGIPEKDIINIFDPFFSTKAQGVGLGLSICYRIIVSHGGTIEVESKPKFGTTFTVSLPIEETTRVASEREGGRERVKTWE